MLSARSQAPPFVLLPALAQFETQLARYQDPVALSVFDRTIVCCVCTRRLRLALPPSLVQASRRSAAFAPHTWWNRPLPAAVPHEHIVRYRNTFFRCSRLHAKRYSLAVSG